MSDVIDLCVTLIKEKTFSVQYPSPIEIPVVVNKAASFSISLFDYGESLLRPLSYWDTFTMGDLDSLSLGEMDYNL